MHFVQNKYFIAVARRGQSHGVNNGLAHFFHLRIGRRVQLQHVHIFTARNFAALRALSARLGRRLVMAVARAV